MQVSQVYQEHCVNMATRLAAVAPGAKSDPFFVARKVTHFLNGVENPDAYGAYVRDAEKRREAAEAVQADTKPKRKSRRKATSPL